MNTLWLGVCITLMFWFVGACAGGLVAGCLLSGFLNDFGFMVLCWGGFGCFLLPYFSGCLIIAGFVVIVWFLIG